MRIALPQYGQPSLAMDELGNVAEFVRLAKDAGAGLVCFGEWFLGVEPVGDFDEVVGQLRRLAAESGLAVVSGNVPHLVEGRLVQSSLVISSEGNAACEQRKLTPYRMEAANFLPGDELSVGLLSFGTVTVLNGLDAVGSSLLPPLGVLRPNFLIMQMNAGSALESEALKELALSRSLGDCHVAILPSLFDPYGGDFQGGSFVACEGEVLAEGMEGETLVVADVNPEDFLPYSSLAERTVVPELLRQKYQSETAPASAW